MDLDCELALIWKQTQIFSAVLCVITKFAEVLFP